ncbi:hypothetical protein [Pacificoceanicola onchidii]|uniref:hypothetical protein n=1 Tax=Pacificoceanicola onchidii TaxID=2562685 RepID=UPI001F117477|nr:hypothetical protein [Pacificoceanicola onchidii]
MPRGQDDFKARLARFVDRSRNLDDVPKPAKLNYARNRLKAIMEKDAGRDSQVVVHKLFSHGENDMGEDTRRKARKLSLNQRRKGVLNKPCEKLEIEDERDQKTDREVKKDRGPTKAL